MDATCARWQFMGSRWSGVTIAKAKNSFRPASIRTGTINTQLGDLTKTSARLFLGRRRSRVLPAGCRFVALAMKRKHDESMDLNELNELRRRAGELVARAGLENGGVKEGLLAKRMFVA